MKVQIWHNPHCSKSRQTLALIEAQGITPEVRLYLSDGLSKAELHAVLTTLGIRAANLIRTGEAEFKEAGLTKDSTEDALIAAMVRFPKLIERPVVLAGEKAALGRPPESVLEIL